MNRRGFLSFGVAAPLALPGALVAKEHSLTTMRLHIDSSSLEAMLNRCVHTNNEIAERLGVNLAACLQQRVIEQMRNDDLFADNFGEGEV